MTGHPHRPRRGPSPLAYRAPRRPPLPAGQLRELVLAHLQAHPQLDFSPAELANVLRRSRGAVINACRRLVDQGQARRTSEQPQRYQATPPAAG